jgi:hypothetical protein
MFATKPMLSNADKTTSTKTKTYLCYQIQVSNHNKKTEPKTEQTK